MTKAFSPDNGTEKKCSACGQVKPVSEFHKHPDGCNGLNARCGKCKNQSTKESHQLWRKANPEKVRAYLQKYKGKAKQRRKKYRIAAHERLNCAISNSIYKTLRGSKAFRHWESLVSFSFDDLKNHLEKNFKPEMTWDNYGTFWHIDHKIPVAAFNFEKPKDIDFKRCWALKNLQPLEAAQNMSKGARVQKPFQPSLIINTE